METRRARGSAGRPKRRPKLSTATCEGSVIRAQRLDDGGVTVNRFNRQGVCRVVGRVPFCFSRTNKAEGEKNRSRGARLLLSVSPAESLAVGEWGGGQQVEQPAETSVWPSEVGVVLFSFQRAISFSTDAELNAACVLAPIFLLKPCSYT